MKNIIRNIFAITLLSSLVFFTSCKPDDSLPVVVANFSANATTIEEGSSVTFTDNSTGNPTTWSWNFEGGTPSSAAEQNPTVVYNTAGKYEVSLTAANEDNSDTEPKSEYITVFKGMQADFIASDTTISAESTITFTDQSIGEPTQWEWTFEGGDPTSSTDKNPEVSYANPGTYEVSLTATNANTNDTETKSTYIRVFELVNADFIADNTEIDEGGSISFTDQSEGTPAEWAWTFEGGTPASSTEQNPTVTYNSPGIYEVTLIASNADTSDTITKTEYITILETDPGLVAYYPFDGDTEDISGNELDGTPNNISFTDDQNSNDNQAVSFPGNASVTIAENAILDIIEEITISAWINTSGTINLWQSILSKGPEPGEHFGLFLRKVTDGYTIHPVFRINNVRQYFDSPFVHEPNQWYHVACTYDGESIKVYVNKELVFSETITGTLSPNNSFLQIGARQNGTFFSGALDEIKIYNRALSEIEVGVLYDE